MKTTLTKSRPGVLSGEDPETIEWIESLKIGQTVHGHLSKMQKRNLAFHRKYFAMLNVAYDNWNPGEINSKYGVPQKNRKRFRKDLAILCGFYSVVIRLDGSTRIEADSISFAKMDDETFEKLYSKTIDVILEKVYSSQVTKEEMENLVNQYLRFA